MRGFTPGPIFGQVNEGSDKPDQTIEKAFEPTDTKHLCLTNVFDKTYYKKGDVYSINMKNHTYVIKTPYLFKNGWVNALCTSVGLETLKFLVCDGSVLILSLSEVLKYDIDIYRFCTHDELQGIYDTNKFGQTDKDSDEE